MYNICELVEEKYWAREEERTTAQTQWWQHSKRKKKKKKEKNPNVAHAYMCWTITNYPVM